MIRVFFFLAEPVQPWIYVHFEWTKLELKLQLDSLVQVWELVNKETGDLLLHQFFLSRTNFKTPAQQLDSSLGACWQFYIGAFLLREFFFFFNNSTSSPSSTTFYFFISLFTIRTSSNSRFPVQMTLNPALILNDFKNIVHIHS